ncbi:FecR domain-containing protein [Pseudomonas sp. Je.1.5.c]|uniref:FecR domain-containing protein n=1 Tax=Pseudomonas sp. Je.1.5.c TaxID=3142839 RepID=UPI003DA91791
MKGTLSAEHRQAIHEAARWYARICSDTFTAECRGQWAEWYAQSALNRIAWGEVESMGNLAKGLPAPVSSATFGAQVTRRQVLSGFLAFTAIAGFASASWRSEARRAWMADYSTEVGRRREVQLKDGSRVLMDAHSSLDFRFNEHARALVLQRGQILVTTALDPAGRPFTVETAHGQLLALGTRFVVSQEGDTTEIAVLESAVRITLPTNLTQVINAGERARFTRSVIGPTRANDASVGSWALGRYVAVDQPLRDLLTQLARYRSGPMTCDDTVAGIRVSGTFPLDDPGKALTALETALPVQAVQYSSYWVHIQPRR